LFLVAVFSQRGLSKKTARPYTKIRAATQIKEGGARPHQDKKRLASREKQWLGYCRFDLGEFL
jgi:hypothetical protein